MKFRKGVGAIVLNSKNKIIAFQRKDFPENWQCPEGGIDGNETPEEAIYRELEEEINLKRDDFYLLETRKESFQYIFDDNIKNDFDGQEKIFFVIKLKEDKFKFKFDNGFVEFINYKTLENNIDIINLVPHFKKQMYEKIIEYFKL